MSALSDNRPTLEEEASAVFVQRLYGGWTAVDQAAFEKRMASDPEYADAYARAQDSWDVLGTHAERAEVMRYREEAIAYARRSNGRRWLKTHRYAWSGWRVAAIVAGVLLLGGAWQLSPYGFVPGQYRTGIGEQKVVDLEDHSTIVLDAATRLRVRFTPDARVVELQNGQAQFSVAKDPTRPFKVEAGGRTIVALGTVFTVEYVDSQVHVAMMEGKVAVVSTDIRATTSVSPVSGEGISLTTGEELRVSRDGRSTVTPKADLEAATAWREGKVIIRSEPLSDVVRRMNRYSRLQIKIDDTALAARQISGVFEAGDTQGFLSAVERYLPVEADYADAHTVTLHLK